MCPDHVEDEIHFLTDCHLYGTMHKYWETIYTMIPQIVTHSNTDKFIYIMTQEDTELTKILLKMVYEWMTFRKFLQEYFYQMEATQ